MPQLKDKSIGIFIENDTLKNNRLKITDKIARLHGKLRQWLKACRTGFAK